MTKKPRMPRGDQECPCCVDRAVTEVEWKYLSEKERGEVSHWIVDLNVPEESPLGESYFYRLFEFVTSEPASNVEYENLKEAYFLPYLSVWDADGVAFSTTWKTFYEERNEILDEICARPCRWREGWALSSVKGDSLSCEETFAKGFYAGFSLELSRTRRPRAHSGDPVEKSILIHDIRFLGRPVTVEFRYLDIQNPKQRKRLHHLSCCYPGSGKNVRRFSARLGARINEALVHHIRKTFVAEGSAVSIDVINRWSERQARLANQALQKALVQYNAAHCLNFSTVTIQRGVESTGNGSGAGRMQTYRFVCRKEESHPLRLLSVYQEKDWNLIGKLVKGEYSDVNYWEWDNRVPIAPVRMFNLAVDFLSAPENDFLCRPGSASPVLGAMLFLMPYSRERGRAVLQKMDGDATEFYLNCYEDLMYIYEKSQMQPQFALVSALPLLMGAEPQVNTPFQQDILGWRYRCEMNAVQWGVRLPVCSAEAYHFSNDEGRFLSSMERPVHIQFPLPSGVETFRELITRLLLMNPATLSVVRGGNTGKKKYERQRREHKGDPERFECAIGENGMLDYRNVIPGIEISELKNLLEQGFPMEERDNFLKRSVDSDFKPLQ